MPDLDASASLMRVTRFATAEPQEELVARGPARDLIAQALAMPPRAQADLMLRVSGADDTEEHDIDAIREIAARPEFTGAAGDWDTAERPEDPDPTVVTGETRAAAGPTGVHADPPEPGDDI